MSDQEFDPVAQMGRDGTEIKRLRARVAELEAALRDLLDSSRELDEAREYARIVPLPGPKAHAVDLVLPVMKAARVARAVLEKR